MMNEIWNKNPKKYPHKTPIYGKVFPKGLPGFPESSGFSPALITEHIASIITLLGDKRNPEKMKTELNLIKKIKNTKINVPFRFPTFCPGCPHRDSASVLKAIKKDFMDPAYMRYKHKITPIDLVFHGDTGCYSMLAFEPNEELMHNYSGMGLGGGTGAGIDPFISNKQLVFMGDGTFFHSGEIAISNAIKNKQDITFIILDNATTAMTGHQPTPGIKQAVSKELTPLQKMHDIARAIGKENNTPVISINPEDRDFYRKTLEKTILMDGVKVLVSHKECGIVVGRRRKQSEFKTIREKGFLPVKKHMNITESVCEHCLECTNSTGCPGLTFKETDYGPKIQIDFSWCVNDGACMKTEVCPSFESVTVKRKKAAKNPLDFINTYSIPEPSHKITLQNEWNAHLSGIGGTGLGVLSGILSRACVKQGYQVRYSDKKGLAIRCGSVFSNILVYQNDEKERSSVIPYGKADLLIGLDLMEATRSVNPTNGRGVVAKNKTTAIVNTENMPTISNIMGKNRTSKHIILNELKKYLKPDESLFVDLESIAQKYFGTKIYNNLILLGITYQKGLLPLTEKIILWAIETVIGKAASQNIQAFKLGRYIAHNKELFINPLQENDYKNTRVHFLTMAEQQFSKKTLNAFREILARFEHKNAFNETFKKDLIRRIYDLICHSGAAYARTYMDLVLQTLKKDDTSLHATKAVIWNLAKLMLIKDEVYVSHLLTCEEKYAHDRRRYDVDPKRGDKIKYTHYNKPHFDIGPFHIEFRINTRDWMLKIVKHCRFLRRILPKWHLKERLCRDWYINLVKEFNPKNKKEYDKWITILDAPKDVTGYREIRYPKEEVMKQKVYDLLLEINKSKSKQQKPINMWALFQKEKVTSSVS